MGRTEPEHQQAEHAAATPPPAALDGWCRDPLFHSVFPVPQPRPGSMAGVVPRCRMTSCTGRLRLRLRSWRMCIAVVQSADPPRCTICHGNVKHGSCHRINGADALSLWPKTGWQRAVRWVVWAAICPERCKLDACGQLPATSRPAQAWCGHPSLSRIGLMTVGAHPATPVCPVRCATARWHRAGRESPSACPDRPACIHVAGPGSA